MTESIQKELVVLVADLDAENAIMGILARHHSLNVRVLGVSDVDIHRHVQRDSGCYREADSFLRPFVRTHKHALVIFDRHGCGRDQSSPDEIESDVEGRLNRTGWQNRCCVVVIDPELEAWVWSNSPNVDDELGWAGRMPGLREWLVSEGLLAQADSKPSDPKKALRTALRRAGKPPSGRLFRRLAERVSLDRCQDRAFLRLKSALNNWFAVATDA